MKILDAQLAKTAFVAGDTLSMGDIPVGADGLSLPPPGAGAAPGSTISSAGSPTIEQRPAFKEHVLAMPFV